MTIKTDDNTLQQMLQDPSHRNEGFRTLMKQYGHTLYWHIRRIVVGHDDAEDVLQETCIRILNHIGSYKGNGSLVTWLYRIATNEALNFLNKQKVRSALQFESLSSKLEEKIDEDPWFNGDVMQRMLMKAIQRLPEKQRLVFVMRWFEELPYEEISEILGTSIGALKASYHFATEKLKSFLEKNSELF